MSDDELRTLARAVEARPGDVNARAAYARALARRGDARGEHRELVRLARDGDRAALARLATWVPWAPSGDPGRHQRRRGQARLPAAAPTRSRSARVGDLAHLVAVGRAHVVVNVAGSLVALDLGDLAPCWRDDDAPAYGPMVVVGETFVTACGRELTSRDLATGEVLARTELPDEVFSLVPLDDGRGVCVYGLTVALLELMPGSLGEREWERPGVDHRFGVNVGGPFVGLQASRLGTQLLQLTSGAPMWPRPRAFEGVARPQLAALDDDLVLVLDERTDALAAFGPDAARLRWRTDPVPDRTGDRLLIVEGDVILATSSRDDDDELAALDRATGEPRWRVRGPLLPGPLPADGGVYVQVTPGHLSCLELATGAERFALPLGDDPRHTLVAPCHDGLILLAGDTLTVHTEPSS